MCVRCMCAYGVGAMCAFERRISNRIHHPFMCNIIQAIQSDYVPAERSSFEIRSASSNLIIYHRQPSSSPVRHFSLRGMASCRSCCWRPGGTTAIIGSISLSDTSVRLALYHVAPKCSGKFYTVVYHNKSVCSLAAIASSPAAYSHYLHTVRIRRCPSALGAIIVIRMH